MHKSKALFLAFVLLLLPAAVLADEAAAQLHAHGLTFDPPGLRLDGRRPTRADGLRTLVTEVAPWVGRRVREYAPAVLSAARGR